MRKEFADFVRKTFLKSIYLKSIEANAIHPFDGKAITAEIKNYTYSTEISGNGFSVMQSIDFEGKFSDGTVAFEIKLSQIIQYVVTDEGLMDEKFVEEYVKLSSVIHGWPYLREHISSLLLRMGYPPFLLPAQPVVISEEIQ